jgi:CheY-like chemotaxis protein
MACILVVEDEVLIRLSLSEWLRSEAHTVVEAASADEAMKLLGSILEIDLMITDIEMPGRIDGLGLAEQFRNERPALPVIVVSGRSPSGPIGALASAFLLKPYDFTRLARLVATLAAPDEVAGAEAKASRA